MNKYLKARTIIIIVATLVATALATYIAMDRSTTLRAEVGTITETAWYFETDIVEMVFESNGIQRVVSAPKNIVDAIPKAGKTYTLTYDTNGTRSTEDDIFVSVAEVIR